MKIFGKNLLALNESKKLFKILQADVKSFLFTKENTNDKLLKKNLKVEM